MSHGHFVWYDLNTTDENAAQSFYTQVTGWQTVPWKNGDYTMFAGADGPMGGVLKLPKEAAKMGAPPHWLAYVTVDDVDASAKWVSENGGQVHAGPFDMDKVGRIAIIADPQGAVIGLFKPEGEVSEPPEAHPVGAVSWSELAAQDHSAALEWYGQLFGWKLRMEMDMGGGNMYRMFGFKELPWAYGGMFDKTEDMPTCAWLYYIKVADLDTAVAKTQELGGQILNGPMPVPGGDRVAQCMDPQGAAFALVGR